MHGGWHSSSIMANGSDTKWQTFSPETFGFFNLELPCKQIAFISVPALSNFATASYKHLNKSNHLEIYNLLKSHRLKNGNFGAPRAAEMCLYICSADLRRFVNYFQNLKKNVKIVVVFV